MGRLGRFVASVLLATVVFFGFGEILTRGLGMVDRLNGYSRLIFMAGPDGDLPYRLRPDVRTRWLGIDVRVNALGFRGADVRRDAAPNARRVLVLGDSVVFGQGVEESDTLTARLGEALGRAEPEVAWEVLNGGVQGYDTIAEARALELLARVVTPDVVVVGMSLNDYDRPPAYHPIGVIARRAPTWTAAIEDRSEFALLLRWIVTWVRGGLWQQVLTTPDAAPGPAAPATARDPIDEMVARSHRAFYAKPDPIAWERLRDGLRRMRRAAERIGASLLVAIVPESWQMDGADVLEPQRRLIALCEDAGVASLDLAPAFREARAPLFLDTQHPNAAGHAVAAHAIAAALVGPRSVSAGAP